VLFAAVAAAFPLAAASPDRGGPAQRLSENPRMEDVLLHLEDIGRPRGAFPELGRGQALRAILDDHAYPGTCATPLVLSLQRARSELSPGAADLLERLGPSEPVAMSAHKTSSLPGAFEILYTAGGGAAGAMSAEDSDLDGVPDEAFRLGTRLQEAREAVLTAFDASSMPQAWPASLEPVHRVIVTSLPGGPAGYVWPESGGAVLVLDRDAVAGAAGDIVLRHQIAHVFQLALTSDEEPWWYEAHAVWAADPGGLDAGRYRGAVASYLAGSSRGLGTTRLGDVEGTFLWPQYLAAAVGPATLGSAWEEMSVVPGDNTSSAFDSALTLSLGSSLASAVRAFRIWNVFLGEMDDGNHYRFAGDLNSAIDSYVGAYPAYWQGPGAVAPLGSATAQLSVNSLPGGWMLEFSGDIGSRWDVTLVTIPARLGERPGSATIAVDEGKGSAAVPWRGLGAVIVVVQNLGGERADPSRFSLSARHDPQIPFDLMSFAPEAVDGGVALRWYTEKETDLMGWRVYRSLDPLTGFAPIQSLLIPAAGGPDMMSYIFLDSTVKPGRKYYYFLEGVTTHGFTEPTHPVSVRVPEAPEPGTLQ